MPLQKSSGAKTVANKKPSVAGGSMIDNSGDEEASRFNIAKKRTVIGNKNRLAGAGSSDGGGSAAAAALD